MVLKGHGFIDNTRLACKIGDGELVLANFSSSTEISCPDPGPFADKTSTVVKAAVNGFGFSAGSVLFTHSRTPFVLSIYPTIGPHGGGTSVFLSGAHFPNSERLVCSFGGLVVPARWLSEELLQCDSPPRPEIDTVVVQVSANGLEFTSDGLTFLFYRTKILRIFPLSGPTDGGTLVSVLGEGFQLPGDYMLRFGLTHVRANFVTSSELQCLTPAGQLNASEVEVSLVADGTDIEGGPHAIFTYTPSVSAASIEPTWGFRQDETVLVLYGIGFANTSELACSFGRDGIRLATTFLSTARISCTVPLGMTKGDHKIEVTTNGLDVTRDGITFSVEEEPSISSITPSSGPNWGGEAIHIKGFNFESTKKVDCLFGSTAVDARWESSTSLWCISPLGNTGGSVQFTVTLDGRSSSSPATHNFTFWGPSGQQCVPGTGIIGQMAAEKWNQSLENTLSRYGTHRTDDDVLKAIFLGHNFVGREFLPSEAEGECGSRNGLPAVAHTVLGHVMKRVNDSDIALNSTVASVLQVLPDHGSYGGNTTVLVAGTNFVDTEDIKCVFGASTVPGRWLSPALVACISAPGKTYGRVPFDVTIGGSASSSSSLFFIYEQHPTVNAVLPSLGSVQGGTVVTFRGDGFVFSSGLRAQFGHIGVPVTFVSPGELRCTCPPSLAGDVIVLVGNHDRTFRNNGELVFSYTDAPRIDGLHPSRGSITGGVKMTVRGQNFVNSTHLACLFGEAGIVTATFVSHAEVDCEVPAFIWPTPQRLEITVNGVDFTSDGNVFTYTEAPAVFSATPDSGSASGGTVVFVEGINFVDSSDLSCHFGNVSVSGRWISAQVVQCMTPVGLASTTVPLTISFAEDQPKIGDVDFFYFLQPTIQGISPMHGSIHGGTTLSILGAGFWFSDELRARFGRLDVPVTFVTPSELRCTTPASSSLGLSSVLVSLNGVDFFGRDGVWFYYAAPTRVVALSPSKGPQSGGTTIAVSGSRFRMNSGLGCTFDGEFVAATYQSETQVICVTPPAKKDRTLLVGVSNDGPESVGEEQTFVYTREAYISSIHPSSGRVSGGTSVVVTGFNFADAQDVRCAFGAQTVSASQVSSTQVRCTSPQASKIQEVAFAIEVEIHRFYGPMFSYHAEPTFLGISPRAGSVEGGTIIDLVGDGFKYSKGLQVNFGAVEVPVVFFNSSLLRCITVASSAEVVEVSLNVDGARDTSQSTWPYTFYSNLRVADITPSRGGVAGGTAISVRGDGFEEVTTMGCRFGSSYGNLVQAEFVSPQEVVCMTPVMAGVGSLPVEVTVNGVDFSRNGHRFTYHDSPFVTSASRTDSNMILVHGGNFVDSEVLVCLFGALVETPGRWISRTRVECTPPASSMISDVEGNTVSLTISFNRSDQTEVVFFEQKRAITFSSLSPSVGPSVGGTTVFLRGSGFVYDGNIRVRFGGIEVPATYLSDVLLKCVSPAGQPGFTDVVPTFGAHAFPQTSMIFQYVPDIKVTAAVTTSDGIAGLGTAVVRGTNFVSTNHLECRFGGNIRVPGVFISASEVWCDIPPLIGFGRTALEVSFDGDFFAPADFIFVDKEGGPLLVLDPSSGPKGGGTLIVISGRRFAPAAGIECLFRRISVPAVWLSEEAIQCESPMFEEVDQVFVAIVVNGYGAGRGLFTYEQSLIVSVLPEKGEDAGGTLVTISGRGFDTVKQYFCWFGLQKTPAVVVDDEGTSLQCLSPPRASSDTSVVLSLGAGSYPADFHAGVAFTYISSLEVISLHPASGSILGGTSIVVTFQHGFGSYHPLLRCDFGEAGSSSSTWLNETAVVCFSPPSSYRGKVLVSLRSSSTNENISGNTSPYWYFYPPTVSFMYPLEVETSSNTPFVVTILGGNFLGSSQLCCRTGDTVVSALWISGSIIECRFVGIFPGERAIEVSNNKADFVPAGVVFVALPSEGLAVSQGYVAPSRGSTGGGTVIEVFVPDVGYLGSVRHCVVGKIVLNATTLSKDRVECVTIAHREGTLPVSVCDSFGSCSHRQGDFSFVDDPVSTQPVPNMGAVHGESVVEVEVLKGCGHDHGDVWCQLGDTPVRASSVREDSVTCTIPSDEDRPFNVSVSCNGPDFSNSLPFKRYPKIVVFDVFPVSISCDGGSVVHVSGKGFQNAASGGTASSSLLCFFDDTPTPALWVSEALVLCRSPPGAPGMVVLGVSTSVHQDMVATANVTYVASGHGNNSYIISPTAGKIEGGTAVSITGTRRLVGPVSCLFGEEATSAVAVSPFEIVCETPTTTAPGFIQVSLVWSDHQEAIGDFEYKVYLQLDRVHPTVADIDGGTIVTVFLEQASDALLHAANTSCRISDVLVPALVHPSKLSAECVAPARPSGPSSIALWSGTYELSGGDLTLSYIPLPVVTRVSPASGSPDGETEVNIYGHNFVYAQDLACFFGDDRTTNVEWLSSTQIRCTVPKLLQGVAQVAVSFDGVRSTSPSMFSTYTVHPHIVLGGLDPAVGHADGGTVVAVTGTNFPSSGGLECLFGNAASPAIVLGQTSLECVSPKLSVGTVAVELQYMDGGGRVDRGEMQLQFQVTTVEPTAHFVSPPSGPVEGGTTLVIAGAHFPTSTKIVCRLQGRNSIVDIMADWLSSDAVACLSPRWHQPERAVAVHLLIGGSTAQSTRNSSMAFDFRVSTIITEIHPRLGPESGGTEIRLVGANFRDSRTLACLVCRTSVNKCTTVSGEWFSSSELRCITPRNEPGLTTVSVLDSGVNITRSAAQYLFVPSSHVTNINPTGGGVEGGTQVLVSGTNLAFTGPATCRFGGIVTKAAFNASGVVCISPRFSTSQKVPLEVSINGADFTSDGHTFELSGSNPEIWSISAQPTYGDKRGNTQVVVHVARALAFETAMDREYECIFDDKATPARVISASSVRCRSPPSLEEGVINLRLRLPDRKGETASTRFDVFPAIELLSLEPASGQPAGGDTLIVDGTGFVDTPLACCRFGDSSTPAEVLSATTLRCVVPPRVGGSSALVKVEVSHNCDDLYGAGLDFRYDDDLLDTRNTSEEASPYSATSDLEHPLQCALAQPEFNWSDQGEHSSLMCSLLVDTLSTHRTRQISGIANGTHLSLSSGPIEGGSTVEISGLGKHKDGIFCRFADDRRVVLASALPLSHVGSVRCVTPPWPASGMVLLQVTSSDMGVVSMPMPFTYFSHPILYSIEPSRGKAGGHVMLHVVISGASVTTNMTCGFFDASHFLLAVSAAKWTTNSDVWCQSPVAEPGHVFVEISANGFDFTQGSGLEFTTLKQPTIFGVSPLVGAAAGGTEVVVRGAGFELSSVALCRFGLTQVPATVVGGDIVVCTAPPASGELMNTGVVEFALVLDGDEVESSSNNAQLFTHLAYPVVSAITPKSGPVTGGTRISVDGENFVDMGSGVECVFGEVNTRATVVSVDRLVCDSPPHGDGEVAIAVRNGGGDAVLSQTGPSFVFTSSVRTSLVAVPSTFAENNLERDMFALSSNDTIRSEWDTTDDVKCISDQEALGGYSEGVGCGNGNVKSILPDNGPRVGGSPVLVIGLYFAVDEIFTCHFGTRQTRGYVMNATHVVCAAPSSSTKTSVKFLMKSNNRSLMSDDIVYYFEDTPVIHHVQPQLVYQDAGTTDVTVIGEGFRNSSSLACLLGSETIVLATFLSDKSVVCPVPQNVEYVRLELTNNGVDFSSSGHGVFFTPRPLITGIDRSSTPHVDGVDVVISGLHLMDVPGLACVVEGQVIPARWISKENVGCGLSGLRMPGLVQVAVTLNHQELGRSSVNLDILPPPSLLVESAQPAFGACDGGTVVTIEGSNLKGDGGTFCRFGSVNDDVVAQVVNDSFVRCVAPGRQAGKTRLEVGRGRIFSAAPTAFTFVIRPTVKSLQPSAGAVHGGTRVTVLGSDFANTTELECYFGTQPALRVVFVSTGELVCEPPQSVAPTVVAVTVRVNEVTSASSINYRYILGATVLDVSPHDIYFGESHWLTVTGISFIQGPNLMCLFNQTLTTSAQWLSSSLLRCPVPIALTPGSERIPVSVTNNGHDISTSSGNVLVRPRWTIYSVSPPRGGFDQSTPLLVVVRAFSQHVQHGAREQLFCLFDDEPVQAVSALASCDTHAGEPPSTCVAVRCIAPPQQAARHASLRIVDDKGAALTNPAMFAFDAMPMVHSISPRFGAFGGGTTIAIEHGPIGLLTLPETAGCQFSDAYDTIYVAGEVSTRESGSLSVVCSSPPWRSHSGHHSAVKVTPIIDGFSGHVHSHSFLYSNRAKIIAVTPSWATDKGGREFRVRGIGFRPHSRFSCFFSSQTIPQAVTKADDLSSTLALRLSEEELICESPARPPGQVYLTVGDDGEQIDGVLQVLIRSSTQVNLLSPYQGLTSGGTVVELSGNFFLTGLSVCRFGSHNVPATYVNSSSLICVSPPSPPGIYPVNIAMDGEHFEDSGLSFHYLEEMRILSLTPIFGWTTGGTNVTVRVAGLQSYGQDASFLCVFGSHREEAINVRVMEGSVVCTSPTPGQTTLGKVTDDVMSTMVSVVESSGAVSATATELFHFVAPVTVTAVIPDRGPSGTPVHVLGEHFDASFGVECLFGIWKARATFVTSQRVDCHAPANQTGQVGVTVLSGGILPAWHARALFTFEHPVILLSLDPDSGRHGESTLVTITGSGFQPSTDLVCRFGELEAAATVVNSTHVRCLAPPAGRGNVRVSLSVQDEDPFLLFIYETKALVPRLIPSEGSIYGGTLLTIRVDIKSPTPRLRCTFASTEGVSTSSAVKTGGATFQCKTPSSPELAVGTAWVSLTQGKTVLAEGASFNFVNPPLLRSIHPHNIYVQYEEPLIISGENFVPSNELACKFVSALEHAPAISPAQFISHTKISCISPVWKTVPTSGIHVSVDVTTNGVDYTSGGPGFMFQPAAKISAVSPSAGLATGGTPVSISGVSLPREKLSCLFGTSIVSAWVMSDSQVVCISPTMPQGYEGPVPLHLTVDGRIVTVKGAVFTYGLAQSWTDPILRTAVHKDDEDMAQHLMNGYGRREKIMVAGTSIPSISRFGPTSCSSSGYVDILIHGLDFSSSPTLTCSFGGVYRNATFLSDIAIKCVAPRHVPGEVFLEVSNDGETFSSSGVTFRFHSDPTVLSIDPPHGPVKGSTLVTITGNHYRPSSKITCRFGDTTVPGLYLSSNQMECWTPPMEKIATAVDVKVRPVEQALTPDRSSTFFFLRIV